MQSLRVITTFVGRDADLTRVSEALARSRLVTVVGPPGVGKTRLVREHGYGAKMAVFCDLSDASTAEEILPALARTLSLEVSDGDLIVHARRVMGERVLILDNFEQLIASGRDIVASLLRAGVEQVVVTSRERLGLHEEVIVELKPLAIADGVTLLVDRAKVLAPSFEVDPTEAADVARLVEELDGLPLAIELAASKVRIVGVAPLLARMRKRFDVLTEHPSVERRQDRTLFEAIESSWAGLSTELRSALTQSTVFRGGFDLDAAEAVLQPGAPVIEVLTKLCDRSLISVQRARFSLLASIRDFADAHVDARVRRAAQRRHAEHYAQRLSEPFEHENVVAAHAFSVAEAEDATDRARVLRIAIGLGSFASSRSYAWRDAALSRAMAAASSDETPQLHAAALEVRGNVRRFAGAIAKSLEDFTALSALAEACDDDTLRAAAYAGLGNGRAARSEWSEARRLYRKALALHAHTGDRVAESRVLGMLAATHFNADEPVAAGDMLARALEVQRETCDQSSAAITLTSLGAVAVALGDHSTAHARLDEALFAARAAKTMHWEGVATTYLALLEQDQKRLHDARKTYEKSLAIIEEVGVRRAKAVALGHYATCLLELGELDKAREAAQAAAELHHQTSPDHLGLVRAHAAAAVAMKGDKEAAKHLLDAAEAALLPFDRPAFKKAVACYRVLLGSRMPSVSRERRVSAELRSVIRIVDGSARKASLVIGPESAWFVAPTYQRIVRLHRRQPLKRVLGALVDQRARAPGEAVSVAKLVERGWPGERVLPQAGAERVYSAVAELRKLGLRGVLVQRDDGYLLDPDIHIDARDTP